MDGQLDTSVNLIQEDGAMKPIRKPANIGNLGTQEYKLVIIHKTSLFTHYIIQKGNQVKWTERLEPENEEQGKTWNSVETFDNDVEIHGYNTVGNTLIILTSKGIQYYLWKTSDYIALGSKIPECKLTFRLQGGCFGSGLFYPTLGGTELLNKDSFLDNATNQILAKVNLMMASAKKYGRFVCPFFVRYAYRLFDETITMQSAPILMYVNSACMPHVIGKHHNDTTWRVNVFTPVCDLYVHGYYEHKTVPEDSPLYVVDENLEQLRLWSDIVKSVDIFISAPIYAYNQSGKIKSANILSPSCEELKKTYGIFKKDTDRGTSLGVCRYYQHHTSYSICLNELNKVQDPNYISPLYNFVLPQKTEEELRKDIESRYLFYLLKSIRIEDLGTSMGKIEIPEDYLTSLETREVMTDDYDSHDDLSAEYSYVYNNRLNITGIRKYLFQGYDPYTFMPYTDGYYMNDEDIEAAAKTIPISFTVFIRQDGKEFCVTSQEAALNYQHTSFFFYYPNINAYKVRFYRRGGQIKDIELKRHDFLNGAYCWTGWDDLQTTGEKEEDIVTDTPQHLRYVDLKNRIYTSEVNNPFSFGITNRNDVGTGEVIAVCSAAKALSQGQFGQFPLYAFTTDGIWALEVSATGTFSARQPITRDVCISRESITQIDAAVLFATKKGIMLIAGAEVMCISDNINADKIFNTEQLKGIGSITQKMELEDTMNNIPFQEFMKECRMIYDYVHSRIIVYRPGKKYAYVFSLKDKTWGMIQSNIKYHVNSYPNAIAVDEECNVIDFSEDTTDVGKAILITRPLKLDMPDIYKTVTDVIQRGAFRKGHVQSIIYGSRDLINWHLIGSSKDHYLRGFRGTPYKYFRIALLCSLSPDETLSGASLQFTPRLTNQPR